MHVSKPAAEIYEHCLKGLGIAAADTLFLDDRRANVEGAKAIGMQGSVFTSAGALLSELADRFDLPRPSVVTVGRSDEDNQ